MLKIREVGIIGVNDDIRHMIDANKFFNSDLNYKRGFVWT